MSIKPNRRALIITVVVCSVAETHIMKAFILIALVAAAAADVSHLGLGQNNNHHSSAAGPDAQATIVSQESDVSPVGFQQSFQTSNGIDVQEKGELKNVGREDEALEVQGKVEFIAADGQRMLLTYIANENGYQPQGVHLPTPPPIPIAIARALEYIAAHPPAPETPQQYNRKF